MEIGHCPYQLDYMPTALASYLKAMCWRRHAVHAAQVMLHQPSLAGVLAGAELACSCLPVTCCVAVSQVMTRIGAICLITIGAWICVELPVQFAHYRHGCTLGVGEYS